MQRDLQRGSREHTCVHLLNVSFGHTQQDKDLQRELILGCQLQLVHLTVYSQLALERKRGAVELMGNKPNRAEPQM